MNTQRRALSLPLLIPLLLTVIVTLVIAACGEPEPSDTTDDPGSTVTTLSGTISDPGDIQLAMSGASRLPASASQNDLHAASFSTQLFGAELYQILVERAGDGNVVFSPASIVTALAMTYAGAEGATAEEMAATLHFDLPDEALHAAFNSLDLALESRTFENQGPTGEEEGVLVSVANSLWAQQDLAFEQDFLDTLAANYGAGVRLVDYVTAAEEARQAINSWVADQTNDKITELLPQGLLNALTRLVLVNAVYLDATWANQFSPEDTSDGEFTTLADEKVTAQMMRQTENLPYAAGDGWQAVELPYLGNELAMLVVVPEQGRLSQV